MTNPIIKPTVGRVVWFHPSELTGEPGFARHQDGQPYAAIVTHVWSDRMVNLTVLDSNGVAHSRTSVELVQDGGSLPGNGYYCEWMPYQKGQAAKTEAVVKADVLANEYRQPSHRERLEYVLVQGAAAQLSEDPARAVDIANGIKNVLNALHPLPSSAPGARAHASAVLYPAIERAMAELSKLHVGFNIEVNRAFNILHDAFWSEVPAPASAAGKRTETPAAEPAPITLPVVDQGAESLEREIQAKASKAPRVTPACIEAEIASEFYFTATDGVLGESEMGTKPAGRARALDLLTFCVLVLKNGFTVTGESACASPENFDAEIGRKIARQKAIEKIWPLLGFRLRDRLSDAS